MNYGVELHDGSVVCVGRKKSHFADYIRQHIKPK